MRNRLRRLALLASVGVALLAVSAGPAWAHFCSKSGWSDSALAHASKSQAWLTAAEWNEFIDWAVSEGEICAAGASNLKTQIASMPTNTLFLGPGLLAGGTLKNGKGNTPSHFNYLDFEAAFGLCSAP